MTFPHWITLQLLSTAIAFGALIFTVGWNVGTWSVKRREEAAEKGKRPILAVTFQDGTEIALYPLGHLPPGKSLALPVFVKNHGNSRAEHVSVTIYLPAWMNPVSLPDTVSYQGRELPFTRVVRGNSSVDGAHVVLDRPVYPEHEPRELGLAVVSAPSGRRRIDWRIESSGGVFESDDATALYVDIYDTAVGHTQLKWNYEESAFDRTQCAECVRLSNMTPAERIEQARRLTGLDI